jgi:hypothetical protein
MLNRYVNVAHCNLEHTIVTSEFVGRNIYCFMLLFCFIVDYFLSWSELFLMEAIPMCLCINKIKEERIRQIHIVYLVVIVVLATCFDPVGSSSHKGLMMTLQCRNMSSIPR